MAQKQISRFPLNEKFSRLGGLSGHVPNNATRGSVYVFDQKVENHLCKTYLKGKSHERGGSPKSMLE